MEESLKSARPTGTGIATETRNTDMVRRGGSLGALAMALILGSSAQGAGLILNEYNAVGTTDLLANERSDSFFGRIEGNGRDWIELVVVDDHLDIRGWELWWYQTDADSTGEAIWDNDRTTPGEDGQGRIIFSDDADWSDLRRGTILTISEQERITDVFDYSTVPATLRSYDLRTDLSFDPSADDWHIHVSTEDEAENTTPLLLTESNIEGDVLGNFAVSKDSWEMTIVDDDGEVVFGPIGEAYEPQWGGSGINDEEVGKLEGPVAPATLEAWQTVDITQFRDGSTSTFGSPNTFTAGTVTQDFSALREMDEDVPGDTNGDGVVDLEDLNNVRNNFGATGGTVVGDTNGDGTVDLEDLNAVRNNFGAGGSGKATPEPSTLLLAGLGAAAMLLFRRR
jgi:hypothetical protein